MLDSLFGSDVLLFSIPALVGTVVFLLKLGLLSLGGVGADADVDVDLDVDAGMDMDHAGDVDDSTHAFQILSIHSIAAFLMGFGWGGLVGFRTFDWNTPSSFALGLAFGAALVWMLAALLQAMYHLQGSGNVNINDTIGRDAVVYVHIPADGAGIGRIRIVINERARFFNAVTKGEEIARNARVRITDINPDNTVTVTPAS